MVGVGVGVAEVTTSDGGLLQGDPARLLTLLLGRELRRSVSTF